MALKICGYGLKNSEIWPKKNKNMGLNFFF